MVTFTGSIPRSPITKSPSNDAMTAFLTSSSASQAPSAAMHPSSVPLPRPRPKRLCPVRCIGIPYASQQRSAKNRRRLQAARLKVFLGELPDSTNTPKKPPFMHKRTYARLVTRLHRLEANSPRTKHKSAKRQFSHKLYHPVTSYDSQRYALA
jgi:hypothetical protein